MSIQIHTATREESNNRAMLAPESKTRSGIVLRAISLGSLEILRQLANPLSSAEKRENLSAVDTRVPMEFLHMRVIYRLTGGSAVSYSAESSMAYRVLSEHEYLLSCPERGVRKGCALEATGLGNRKTAQEAAEEATAYDANNLNQYTAIQEGTAEACVPTFDADGKAPDGCKGDWTNAQHLPEGRGAVGRLRVNQTKVKTSTGIWNVVYNAENRPVTFMSEDGATVVECTYDKAPEGSEGDWTNTQHLPRRGELPMGRQRVNPFSGVANTATASSAWSTTTTAIIIRQMGDGRGGILYLKKVRVCFTCMISL